MSFTNSTLRQKKNCGRWRNPSRVMKVAAIAGSEVSSYQRFEYGKCALQKSNLRLALTLCRILDIDPYAVAHLDDDEALGLYAKDYSA